MRKITWTLIFLFYHSFANAQDDCLPVKKLKSLCESRTNFRLLIDSVFLNIQSLPDGSPNYWKNKNLNDLYTFLNKWFYTLPTTSNGLDDILLFSQLYYHNNYGLRFVSEEPGLSWTLDFVKEQGKFMDSRFSTGSIGQWLADSSLYNSEYITPQNGYTSFNQFFTRNLKPGMRLVSRPDDDAVLVSPVDGTIVWIKNDLKPDSALPVKGRMKLNINQLLGHSKFANNFIDGTALSIFLLPKNYHHFHAPVSGELIESKEDAGSVLFGSQIIDFFYSGVLDFSVFENYKHGYFIFKTKNYGYIAMIPVGLETVGSINFETKVKNISENSSVIITKGEKLGHFAYGGSTVMLLFQKGKLSSLTVQQGQQIGIFNK